MGKAGVVTEAVNTKVTTRQTYVLTGIEGDLKTVDGKLAFIEKDGIDYAATTVQLPGGERVPFLFTVKNLVAKADSNPSSIDPGLRLAVTRGCSTRTTRSSTFSRARSSSRSLT